jgi:hypothetical protein
MTTKVHSYLGGLGIDATNKFTLASNATVTIGNGTSTGNVHVGGEVAATTFIGDGSSLTGVEAGVGYTNSSTSVVPGTTNTDLGNLTDASEDAFGIASITKYDLMDPIGSLVTLDLGAF